MGGPNMIRASLVPVGPKIPAVFFEQMDIDVDIDSDIESVDLNKSDNIKIDD